METLLLKYPEGCRVGRFLRREKRFFVHAELDGQEVLAHTNNTGTMLGLLRPGCPVLLSPAQNPARKLKWTVEALGNLLDNAVKYTPEGGSVSVLVRPWQFYTRIDITDTGIGIPEEHYHDVFQRFYRAPEVAAQEGVGLGLYLANGIITRQKGYISVKSKVGEGTTFSVYLLS